MTQIKRDIGKQDIRMWDGSSATFNANSATGRPFILDKIDWPGVDVYAVYGSRTQAAISSACARIGTTNLARLYLSPGTWTISSDCDLSAYTNIYFYLPPGATLSVAATKTLTLYGPSNVVTDGNGYRVFVEVEDDDGNLGEATFSGGNGAAYPEWWYDGGGDWTNAIQAMFDAGKACWMTATFQPKAYAYTTTLNWYPGYNESGSGAGATCIEGHYCDLQYSGSANALETGNAAWRAGSTTSAYRGFMRNVEITGTSSAKNGLVVCGLSGWYFENIFIHAFSQAGYDGLHLTGNRSTIGNSEASSSNGSFYNTFVGCYSTGNDTGARLTGVGSGGGQANSNAFIGGAIRQNTDTNIELVYCNCNTFNGLSLEAKSGTDYGVYFINDNDCNGNMILNCRFEGTYDVSPWELDGDNDGSGGSKSNVLMCNYYGAGYIATLRALNSGNGPDLGVDNFIFENDLVSGEIIVKFPSDTMKTIMTASDDISLVGAQVHLKEGLSETTVLTADSDGVKHQNTENYRNIQTIASGDMAANVLVLPAGNLFLISGTTAITSIDSASSVNGRVVFLRFSGVLDFTDGNNLKLATTMTTSADDTITLMCDGTNWYELARSAN